MKTVASLLLVVVACGCARRDESVAKTAGNKVGETITDFASGVGKGVDKQRMVRITLSEAVCKQRLSKTIAKSGKENGITVYFLAAGPFKGKLVAKATNKEGQEIGRSVVDVEFSADDAKYVSFPFPEEMDAQLVQEYRVDIKR
ncbi:MAG: hypothetical protein ACLQLG_07175 [Thermoguttaceae bacterium]